MTDDLLAALQAALTAPEPDAQWMTTREIRRSTGMSEAKTLDALRSLAEAGRLETRRVVRANLAGTAQQVPGYRLRSDG